MSDFGDTKSCIGRKAHRCLACYGPIPQGERHWHFKGRYDDAWQDWRMHHECYAAYEADGYGEFLPGDYPMPERAPARTNDALAGER